MRSNSHTCMYLLQTTMKTIQKYFVDDDPYTDEEIVEMAGYSFDDLNKAATSLSIDDVISRHSN